MAVVSSETFLRFGYFTSPGSSSSTFTHSRSRTRPMSTPDPPLPNTVNQTPSFPLTENTCLCVWPISPSVLIFLQHWADRQCQGSQNKVHSVIILQQTAKTEILYNTHEYMPSFSMSNHLQENDGEKLIVGWRVEKTHSKLWNSCNLNVFYNYTEFPKSCIFNLPHWSVGQIFSET